MNQTALEMIMAAIKVKALMKHTNEQLLQMLERAEVECPDDATKKDMVALLDAYIAENSAPDDVSSDEDEASDDVPTVAVFSHNEVVCNLKDDGTAYKKGAEYNGKNVESLCASGKVVAVYVQKPEDEVPTEGNE